MLVERRSLHDRQCSVLVSRAMVKHIKPNCNFVLLEPKHNGLIAHFLETVPAYMLKKDNGVSSLHKRFHANKVNFNYLFYLKKDILEYIDFKNQTDEFTHIANNHNQIYIENYTLYGDDDLFEDEFYIKFLRGDYRVGCI